MTNNRDSISLNKFIADTGYCSRREADKLIESGKVTLNGIVARKGNRVESGDIVKVKGKPIHKKPPKIYIALNKPVGIVSTTDQREKDNIIDFIDHPERLFTIGRLDKMSQGLILLTNDGDIVNKILRAGNKHEKEYIVTVDKKITPQFIDKMSNGLPILDTVTLPCEVVKISNIKFKITLIQGLNRQIRRMCEHLGYRVKTLKRTRIMNITLKGLNIGIWRDLTRHEIRQINALVADSAKTTIPLPPTRKNHP